MSFASARSRDRGFRVLVVVGLILFVVWSAAPILWLIVSSLMQQQALIVQPPDFSLGNFTLENFTEVIVSAAALGRGILNSFIVALFSTAVALVIGAPAAYALARLAVPRANALAFLVLATQMLPGIAIAIPLFLVISRLGLIDNVLALGLVYLSFNLPIVIWILRGFFLAIPEGIEKAAAVDGAGVVGTFLHIVLPISIPPLGAAAVFAFVEAWNEFFFALILTRQDAQTVPLVIAQFAGQYQTLFGQMMAAAAISIAPVIALAIIFRNQIVRGFADGMMKG
ncbi:multiple sugar transport system permease protein [Rhodobium orientis]|uniref:Sugar ABC transporter permease n=1 Tax=Rhodobium orientis TaxID=34017 RepID=A0A327JRS0_9HYPH|nr:carbohydrate ABC transporter permease [Rhodobium orientis]MBB4303534.1 multiple sugar transport system permease protein [Rhodobium orientis]MBK5950464.1 sugar ABC transporter permease [Rhodobium orientis]RAI28315.1 sugar ABC transporter permease [Rhodobium orientis]